MDESQTRALISVLSVGILGQKPVFEPIRKDSVPYTRDQPRYAQALTDQDSLLAKLNEKIHLLTPKQKECLLSVIPEPSSVLYEKFIEESKKFPEVRNVKKYDFRIDKISEQGYSVDTLNGLWEQALSEKDDSGNPITAWNLKGIALFGSNDSDSNLFVKIQFDDIRKEYDSIDFYFESVFVFGIHKLKEKMYVWFDRHQDHDLQFNYLEDGMLVGVRIEIKTPQTAVGSIMDL